MARTPPPQRLAGRDLTRKGVQWLDGWGAFVLPEGELKGADLFEGKFPFSQAEPIAPRGVGGEAPKS